MHSDAADIVTPDLDFTGVQAGAKRQADLLRSQAEG